MMSNGEVYLLGLSDFNHNKEAKYILLDQVS